MPKPLPLHPNVRRCTHIKVSGQQCGSPRGTQKTPASTASITGSASNRWCAKSRLRPQYLIEYPEFGPPIEPRSAGAPAREAATAPARNPSRATSRRAKRHAEKHNDRPKPRSGETTQPTAQAVGQNPKTIQLQRSESTLAIHPRTRSRTRKKTTDPISRSRDPRRNGRKLARSPRRLRVRRNQRTELGSPGNSGASPLRQSGFEDLSSKH
jgi:hypothetical protein